MGYGDGSFIEQSKGHWVGFKTIEGTRYKRTGPSKTAVKAKFADLTKQIHTGTDAKVVSTVTVSTLVDEWLTRDLAGRNRAPSTVSRHEWAAAHIKKAVGKKHAAKLTVRDVEAMLDHLAEDGLARASLTKVLQTLSESLRFGVRRGDLIRNVASDAKIPPSAKRARARSSLSPDDARKLLAALVDERNGLMLALSLRLGLRPGEAGGLFWEDVENNVVNVTRAIRRENGRVVVSDDLKTATAKRTIEMPDDLVPWFVEHRRRQLAERLAARSWADERLVFTGSTGAPLSPSTVRAQLHEVCARAQVPRVAPNELRHSCASLLSDEGVPNELIADLLGHTSTRMVDEVYRHRLRPVVSVAATASWAKSS